MFVRRDRTIVTEDDEHAVVAIVSIILTIGALTAFSGRLFTKLAVVKTLGIDDYTMITTMVFALIETGLIIGAAQNGLGEHWQTLSTTNQATMLKTIYTSEFFYLAVLVGAKVSVAMLIRNVIPVELHTKVADIFSVVVFAWGVSCEFAAAFICGGLSTWREQLIDDSRATQLRSFWISTSIISILTDTFLVVWPVYVFRKLHTENKNRFLVIFCFAARILVIAVTVAQLACLGHPINTGDPSHDLWLPVVIAQLTQSLTITIACIPYLRGFLDNLTSGLFTLRTDHIEGYGQGSYGSQRGTRKVSHTSSGATLNKSSRHDSIPLKPLPLHANPAKDEQRPSSREDTLSTRSTAPIVENQQISG